MGKDAASGLPSSAYEFPWAALSVLAERFWRKTWISKVWDGLGALERAMLTDDVPVRIISCPTNIMDFLSRLSVWLIGGRPVTM